MPIFIGDSQLVRRFVGDQEVQRVYRGDQLVWSASTYPVSGTWAGGAVPSGIVTQASHTITENGNYTIVWSIDYTTVPSGSFPAARIQSNGTLLRTGTYRTSPGTSTADTTVGTNPNLVAGDVITFCTVADTAGAVASGGTWTITKN